MLLALSACGTVEKNAGSAIDTARLAVTERIDTVVADAGLDDLNRDRLEGVVGELSTAISDQLPEGVAEPLTNQLDELTAQVEEAARNLDSAESVGELSTDASVAADDIRTKYEEIRRQLDKSDLPPEARRPLDELDRRIDQVVEGLETVPEGS